MCDVRVGRTSAARNRARNCGAAKTIGRATLTFEVYLSSFDGKSQRMGRAPDRIELLPPLSQQEPQALLQELHPFF
jgi:hypothetical protein